MQARNLTTDVSKLLDLKSSSEQIFSKSCRWVPLFIFEQIASVARTVDKFFFERIARAVRTDNNFFKRISQWEKMI